MRLRKFHVYTTRHRLYLVGRTKAGREWRVVKFGRDARAAADLEADEDPTCYTERECASLLAQVHHGNVQHGGLKHEATVTCPGPTPGSSPPVRCLTPPVLLMGRISAQHTSSSSSLLHSRPGPPPGSL